MMVDFNTSQRLGLDLDRHIALDAGAGTGKTTVMAERYVQHLIAVEQRATHVTPQGPRTPLSGHGALRTPKRERTDSQAWPGLLPSEVVAITFTRKSAAELKARIRHRLALTRATHLSKDDDEGIFDPRLRSDGDVEMLLSALDEAPISTIDAFLHHLVQPYIDLVALYPSHRQVSQEIAPLMVKDTLQAVWRIRTTEDAREAGVLNHHDEVLAARNRLVARLGGQDQAEIVLKGLMARSLFVEQSHRSMIHQANELGLTWQGRGPVPIEVLLDTIATPVAGILEEFVNELRQRLLAWTDVFMPYHHQCISPAETDTHLTRFNHLRRSVMEDIPEQIGEQLSWTWKVLLALATSKELNNSECKFFPSNGLTSADKWPSGMVAKSNVRGLSTSTKADLYQCAEAHIPAIKALLNTPDATLIRFLSQSAFLLNPGNGFEGMPLDCPLRLDPLEEPLPLEASERGMYVTPGLQTEVLSDLMVLHTACQQILARRKSLDGMHDFDDMQRFAADLLLARCPDVCRHQYPPAVIDILDSLGEDSWSDVHISRALTMLQDSPKLREDLLRRFGILSEIRRHYRAFIIDEYQDTNPSHYRLLARLWGRRHREVDDPERPLGPWDPTVCIVGDMKQSIYRFRQAEVSVMRRTVAAIREFNVMESQDSRLQHLRVSGCGRDPRPVGAGGETGSFSNEHDGSSSAPHSHIPFHAEDDEHAPPITGERLLRRSEGHIDLTSNHRTRHNLMMTMNAFFDEVFDARYHEVPGDWHADAQRLRPARNTPAEGVLEWLLPIRGDVRDIPLDLDVAVATFEDPSASPVQLEHELIAQRLQALLHHRPTRVWDSNTSSWVQIAEEGAVTRPEDVMILINSRKHLPDLIARLRARNIPVMADRQGQLLAQPSVQPLMALLGLIADPLMRKVGVEFARSAVMAMTERQIHDAFSSLPLGSPVLPHLIAHAPNVGVRQMLEKIEQYISWGALYNAFDHILDHSDLLVAYPDDAQRQFAEAWLALMYSIGEEFGHDAAAIYRRMVEVRDLDDKGPQAITTSTSAAVQIMTIHASKGLQAPVVVVSGLFSAGVSDVTQSVKDNILVTPQIVAGRIQPWRAKDRPSDGLWEFASSMNTAQDKAELRRKFYVALTRVKDRLILAGSPGSTSTFDATTGTLSVRIAPDRRTMGRMLIDGLRRAAWNAQDASAPWLTPAEIASPTLPPFSPLDTQTALNPALLLSNSPLGEHGVRGLRLYHHPDCFDQTEPISIQQRIRALSAHLDVGQTRPQPARASLVIDERLKGAAHHLDSTNECKRRYWLEEVKGWPSEPFRLYPPPSRVFGEYDWPKPTEFGLMMHRIMEIGLRNPLHFQTTTPPLDESWAFPSEDDLASSATIDRVMTEFGYQSQHADGADERVLRLRLQHLASLIDQGLLGQWVQGKTQHGWLVEAVRTELPFIHTEILPADEPEMVSLLAPHGAAPARLNAVHMEFNGRADLVLALCSTEGEGALMVVDLKTKGCLHEFNETNPLNGHPLQHISPDELTTEPQSEEEKLLLHEHRLQLSLYALALEAMENKKPVEQQRKILPPSILIGANGRMIQLSVEEFEQSKLELRQHLMWRAAVHLNPELQEPERLSPDATICFACPYYRGDIRRCGPQGVSLGAQPFKEQKQ